MASIKVFASTHEFTPEQVGLDLQNTLQEGKVEMAAYVLKVRHEDNTVSYPSCISKGSRAELSWMGRCLQLRAEEDC